MLVRCGGCDNLHLIADRLGWFEDGSVDVHELVRRYGAEGETVRSNLDGGTVQLTREDMQLLANEIASKRRAREAAEAGAGSDTAPSTT